jgi:hypothetical protein
MQAEPVRRDVREETHSGEAARSGMAHCRGGAKDALSVVSRQAHWWRAPTETKVQRNRSTSIMEMTCRFLKSVRFPGRENRHGEDKSRLGSMAILQNAEGNQSRCIA